MTLTKNAQGAEKRKDKFMKIIITRSYSEKWNMGNYQTSDFSATRSLEMEIDSNNDQSYETVALESEKLFEECWNEVKESIAQAKFEKAKLDNTLQPAKVGSKAKEESKFVTESDIQAMSEE